MKKLILAAVAALTFATAANAQTNIQTFYDFGRGHFTTTLEGFHSDSWGNTFFFVDYDYDHTSGATGATGSYMEVARKFNFWQDSALGALSAQVEYNGGIGFGNSNFLFGPSYFLHNADFSNTFNFSLLYKTFNGNASSDCPIQFTFVWGMNNLLGVKGLSFSGFADVWGENVVAFAEDMTSGNFLKAGKCVFLTEPQLWYNVGQFFGCDNLNLGGEVEISYNFAGYTGLHVRPCAGMKWVF